MSNYSYSPEYISEKQSLLENARLTLKKEFIGIDSVIDQLIQSVSTWFLFPELQERPVVVNLWGMTGVGKTALVKRLTELIHFNNKMFRFDLGNSGTQNYSMKALLKENFYHHNGEPYMLVMDEFQFARTKVEDDREISNHFSRVLWDLLDSGKFESNRNAMSDIEEFVHVRNCLQLCLQEGVVVKNGLITEQQELFIEISSQLSEDSNYVIERLANRHSMQRDRKGVYSFLPASLLRELHKYSPNQHLSFLAFKKKVYSLDGPQSIQLLNKVIEYANSNRIIDCSKTLILILGNLDEAYHMCSNMNPDISADDFHEASLRINVNNIKRALAKRFRMEQISRLGNNHIIYPAFSRKSFEQLIELELNNVTAKYKAKFNIQLRFSEAFKQMIYNEGVYPTQGARPLFSTIYQMVDSHIPMLIAKNILNKWNASEIVFDIKSSSLVFTFVNSQGDDNVLTVPVKLNLEKLRKPSKDDMQAITAVHESGHAVVSMAARHIVPDYICSTTSDAESSGFVMMRQKWSYLSKGEGVLKIAELLGGMMAEKLIFGENKITSGCEEDLEKATGLASGIVRDFGMGSIVGTIDLHGFGSRRSVIDVGNTANEEVKALLAQGKDLAESLLAREHNLLLHLADYLSDERRISKHQIIQMVNRHGSEQLKNTAFIEDGKHLFYREHLKNLVQRNQDIPGTIQACEGFPITMNKINS